jgi:toxin ParE1/3/4
MVLKKLGVGHADKYFNSFFEYFEIISMRPISYESVDFIRPDYRRCVCGSDSIYFRVIDNTVEIMAIIGGQDIRKKYALTQKKRPLNHSFDT